MEGNQNHRRLTLKETAKRLGISPKTVYNRLSNGTFPLKVRRFGRQVGFLEADLNQYLKEM